MYEEYRWDHRRAGSGSYKYEIDNSHWERRNFLLNAEFNICQKGTTFATPMVNSSTLDRWMTYLDGTGVTYAVSRQAFTLGQTEVPFEPAYFLRVAQTATPVGQTCFYLYQNVHDLFYLPCGSELCWGFWAKGATEFNISLIHEEFFGVGGSSSVQTTIQTFRISTSWLPYRTSFKTISLSGKTLGTLPCHRFMWALPYGNQFQFDLALPQVEKAFVLGEFQKTLVELDLWQCRRYLFRDSATDVLLGSGSNPYHLFGVSGYNSTSTMSYFLRPLPNRMIVTPTLSATGGNMRVMDAGGFRAVISIGTFNDTSEVVSVTAETSTSGTAGQGCMLQAANDVTAFIEWDTGV